jgi:DNA-binding NarL/FixJ family response regulator
VFIISDSLFILGDETAQKLALKLDSTQPLLIPLSQDVPDENAQRITVHLAISDFDLERATLNLLGRRARFSVVKGSIGYAAESDVRIIDEAPNADQLREFGEQNPPKILFIGLGKSEETLIEAVRAGAWAYISESDDVEDLEQAICSLVDSPGSPLLKQLATNDSGARAVLQELAGSEQPVEYVAPIDNPLTLNEIDILELVARGDSSKVIGEKIGLVEQTVKNYVVNILDKTHTHNRAHAAAVATQRGWLSQLDSV